MTIVDIDNLIRQIKTKTGIVVYVIFIIKSYIFFNSKSFVKTNTFPIFLFKVVAKPIQLPVKMKLLIPSSFFLLGANAFAPVTKPAASSMALNAERQPIMAGNWKMNPATEEEALELADAVAKALGEETCAVSDLDEMCTEVVIFPPFPFISKVKDSVEEAGLAVGAQNFFFEDSGAFTGSVSAPMIKSVGCEYVLCGHSERRTLFADDDVNINKKVRRNLSRGWIVRQNLDLIIQFYSPKYVSL